MGAEPALSLGACALGQWGQGQPWDLWAAFTVILVCLKEKVASPAGSQQPTGCPLFCPLSCPLGLSWHSAAITFLQHL